jgi:hypothetical protein
MQSEGVRSPPPQPSILRRLSHIPLFTLDLFNTRLTFLCFLLPGPANGMLHKKTSDENVTRLSHFSERMLLVRSISLLSL